MEKSTVYFTDFRCSVGTSQLDKLKKLCVAAAVSYTHLDVYKRQAFHRGSLYFLHHLQSDTPSFAACLSCHYNLTLCCLFLRCADEDSKEYDRKYDTYRVRNCSTEV